MKSLSTADLDLKELITYAYEHSRGWNKRLTEAGVNPKSISSIEELKQIPVLKKENLPHVQGEDFPFGGLTTVDVTNIARIFMSPGPIYDPQANKEDFWRFAEALHAAGFGAGDIVQNTFSYHLSPAGFMFDSGLRKLGATVIPTGIGNTELQIQVMKDLKVTGFVGTPSYFATILDAAEQKGWKVGKELAISKAFFTAEMLPIDLRRSFEEKGIRVYEGYGTADAGCIAYQDSPTLSDQGLKVSSSAIVQICDPNTGVPFESAEPGEIVVTLLDKEYPLIRFGTGDLSKWVPGYEGDRIQGVLGRVSDGVKVKGMFIHEKQLIDVMKNESYENYQAVITRENHRDQFTLYVETEAPISEGLAERIKGVLRIKPTVIAKPLGSIGNETKKLIDERVWESSNS